MNIHQTLPHKQIHNSIYEPTNDKLTNFSLVQPISSSFTLVPIDVKLSISKYAFWRSQVLPGVRSHDLQVFTMEKGYVQHILSKSNHQTLVIKS